ncbi:MAG TPA: DUF3108 domain-containing protein [Geobacteraceae bacterium]|nr:DUF3108 domain-containing protein [Geobacteraceae bacterium]
MKKLTNLSLPLGLFILLSILLHLLVWTGLSGSINAFLLEMGRIPQHEVIDVQVAEPPPPEPQIASTSSAANRTAIHARPVSDEPPSPSDEVPQSSISNGLASADQEHATPAEEPSAPVTPSEDAGQANPTPQVPEAEGGQNASPGAESAQTTANAKPPPDIFPFERERLTFALYWSGIHVGTATMEAVRGTGTSYITSVVNSNAVISEFYKVQDRAEARIVNGRPAGFTLIQSEGKHRRNRETIFDPERDKVIYINHLDKSRQEHDMNGKLLWDVISGFYYARRQPLEIGKSLHISMFDSNKFLNTEVKVLRRERVKMYDGKEVPTIIVEPILKSEGLFQKTGEILIWLTDDERRMPVRMETKLKIGRVTAELKSFSVQN